MKERLTKQRAVFEHRKMWNWIADECLRRRERVEKLDYFDKYDNKDIPRNFCWCCGYANGIRLENPKIRKNFCESCPIFWGDADGCVSESSTYVAYEKLDCSEYGQASMLARKIANLPERKMRE